MGAYITQTDLESAHGTTNVRQWSNLDNSTQTTNTTRVATAISYAESKVNAYFRGKKYLVPIEAGDDLPILKKWCTNLAAYELYTARGMRDEGTLNKLQALRDEAVAEIGMALGSDMQMAFALNRRNDPSAPVVVR